ncbi:MAG: PAS domain S-box protein [Candidatus Rokubacteria bacterium]|nr:PAS domain S-box protein [Candidatus Rokubacteria bacterium]
MLRPRRLLARLARAFRRADRTKFVNDLIDSVPLALSVRGIDGRYTLVNRKWEQYYGITRQRAVGAVAREVLGITPEEAAPREALDRAALERGPDNPLETPDFRYRGRRYASRRTAMTDARGRPIGVVVATVDVTEQRAVEEALATEQRRLGLVVRAAKAGIVDWDGTTRTAYYSSRLKELLGYPGDADTSGWPDYFDMVHPDDKTRVHGAFRAHVLARDGREFHEPIEYRLRRADGSYVWVQGMGVSVRDEQGFATRFIASITDITERRAQEEALRESVRLREEVDRISRHDLKTPLNTVIAVSRLLREERTPSAEDAELLSMVERAGYRLLNMVNLSLDLFKMEQETYTLHPQTIDLARVVDSVVADLERHAASKDVTVRVEGGAGALALGEELLCYSILANLLKNAVEASPDGGVVTVSMDDGAQVRRHGPRHLLGAADGPRAARRARHGNVRSRGDHVDAAVAARAGYRHRDRCVDERRPGRRRHAGSRAAVDARADLQPPRPAPLPRESGAARGHRGQRPRGPGGGEREPARRHRHGPRHAGHGWLRGRGDAAPRGERTTGTGVDRAVVPRRRRHAAARARGRVRRVPDEADRARDAPTRAGGEPAIGRRRAATDRHR